MSRAMNAHPAQRWSCILLFGVAILCASCFESSVRAGDQGEFDDLCTRDLEDCFTESDVPGCNDPICCSTICAFNEFCCEAAWDAFCIADAEFLCEPLPACPAEGSCYEVHEQPGCDDESCCSLICSVDGFCCSGFWDEQCVLLANELCESALCTLPPPAPGEIEEPELCVERINEGCNMPTDEFTPILCGDVIRGTAFSGAPRDTDWYALHVTQPTQITWTVTSEFPSQILIIRGDCEHAIEVMERGFGGDCSPATLTMCAAPGMYFLFVSPGTPAGPLRGGVVCPDEKAKDPPETIYGIEYLAEATCQTCPGSNPADLNGDGVVDVFDLLILLSAWGACPGDAACPADLNGDGQVDVFDLLILLANWG